MDSQNKALYIFGWVVAGIIIVAVVVGKIFTISLSSVVSPCLFHSWFGLYCPGCGGTRAVISLFKGQILSSLIFHPVVPYAAGIYVWYMGSNTIQLISKGKYKIGIKYNDLYLWLALWIIIISCIIKNVVYIVWGFRIIP